MIIEIAFVKRESYLNTYKLQDFKVFYINKKANVLISMLSEVVILIQL
jgi:hypothetical protein